MRNYTAFLKKELIEGIRTYKAIILVAIFLIFGIMNPLFAKLAPDLLATLAGEGISISIPQPTALDSWMQFFKNTSQMGLIVFVVIYGSTLSQEVSRGTLINMLTKGLSRTAVILAKQSAILLVWTLSYALCILVTLGYTIYLFPENNAENLVFSLVALWLFGVLLFSFLMLAAAATKQAYSCLLAVALFVGALMLLNIAPSVHDFNPLSLAADSSALITGVVDTASLVPALIIAALGSCACLAGAVLIIRKRQIFT